MIEIHWTVALAMSFCSMLGVLQMYGRRIDSFFKRVVDNMLRVYESVKLLAAAHGKRALSGRTSRKKV
ncbi:hypothetical protein L4C42_00640 [Vibrio wakamikoensis]|uniref:hypothetical protein n=1 Tax=Vibrio wakamikoensis TaxID=2910251 RepID=UPI003D1E4198